MSGEELFTREEAVSGLPARRASTLLFLIEGRTALLKAKSRRTMERFLTEEAAKERDLAYLEAFSAGKSPPIKPTIQDLERFAAQWADLVPDNPQVRAATAHAVGQKYNFSKISVPGIKTALGLDNLIVQSSYQRLYNQPLESIYAIQIGLWDQIHWRWLTLSHWLESLSPFWTAFSLTLTETVGAGILALPIALASIGPLIGIPLLIVLGLVNVLTVAAMAEAASRSVNIRYGNAYFGRMVSDYLGKTGSVIVSITMAILIILVLLAYYFGFSSTLENATRIPAMVWAIFLFMITLYFVRRESLNATIASALVVGAINISLILVLSALSIGHVKITNLLYTGIPYIHNQTFSSSILGPIFGVVLLAYFGHTSVGNCAKVVLQRDPSGRTLIWGCMSGQLAAIAIYIIWIFAVNGAVAPQELANQSGTSLIPLARIVGPEIIIIGSLYVLLAIGMGSVHFSLGLYNLVRERIPNAGIGQIRASETRRKLILISPLIGIFLISELFLFLRNASFTQPLSFVGVIVISLLGGIIPMLLLISSRKKGEIIPGFTFKILSLPGITPSIYLIFLSSLLIHGLVIWRNSVQGVMALVVGIATIVLTILLNQRGAFSPRLLLELHSDRRKVGKVSYSITSAGSPVPSDIQIRYPESEQTLRAYEGEITDTSSLQSAIFQIPAKLAWDLKVYAYQDGLGDPIEGLPVHLDIQIRDRNQQFDLIHLNGEVLTMLQGQACKIVVSFVHRQREMIHGNL